MLNVSNTNAAGAADPALSVRPFTVAGNRTAWTLFSPTARSLVTSGQTNLTVDESDRTAHTCFARGFSEHLKIQTSSGVPWLWRRICFTLKPSSPFHFQASPEVPTNYPYVYQDSTTRGMTRLWLDISLNAMPNTWVAMRAIMFKGEEGSDWLDPITAMVDRTRISVRSDTTTRLMSGNQAGTFKEFKRWYPMNKNIVYGDDEAGPVESPSYFSTGALPGMGDYFIMDIMQPGTGSTVNDLLQVTSTSRYYWHEK